MLLAVFSNTLLRKDSTEGAYVCAQNHPSYLMPSSAHLSTDTPITVSLTPVADLAVRQAYRNLDRIDVSLYMSTAAVNGIVL